MASSRQSKAKKHDILDKDQAGPSSDIPSKRSKKASAKTADAMSKEEMRLHLAIERSIQKAIKEASIKEVEPPAPALALTSTPTGPSTTPPVQVQALSPDGNSDNLARDK